MRCYSEYILEHNKIRLSNLIHLTLRIFWHRSILIANFLIFLIYNNTTILIKINTKNGYLIPVIKVLVNQE